jgi:hypothetical protein
VALAPGPPRRRRPLCRRPFERGVGARAFPLPIKFIFVLFSSRRRFSSRLLASVAVHVRITPGCVMRDPIVGGSWVTWVRRESLVEVELLGEPSL